MSSPPPEFYGPYPSRYTIYTGPFPNAMDEMMYIMFILQQLRFICLRFLTRDHRGELGNEHQAAARFIRTVVASFPVSVEDIPGSIRRIAQSAGEYDALYEPLPFVFGFNLHPQFQRAFDPPRPSASNPFNQQSANSAPSADAPQVAAIANVPQLVANTPQLAVNASQVLATQVTAQTSQVNTTQLLATQVAAEPSQVVSNTPQITANASQVLVAPSQVVSNTPQVTADTPQVTANTSQVTTDTPQVAANTSQVAANASQVLATTPQVADNVSPVVARARQVLINARQVLANAGRRVVTPPISVNVAQVIANASQVVPPNAPTTGSSPIADQPPSLPRPLPPIPSVSQQTSSTPADKTKAVIPTALTVPLSAPAQVPRGDSFDSKGKTKAAVTRTAVPLPSPRPGPRRGRQSIAVQCRRRRSSGKGEVRPPSVVVSRGDGASSANLKRPREEGEQDLESQVKRHCGEGGSSSFSRAASPDGESSSDNVPRRGQPLRREGSYLEEVDLPPGDPRAGLTFFERLELERQRAQYITPAPSWEGSSWSLSNSAPGPSRTPSPSTDDSNGPRRRGKPLQREGAFIEREGVQDGSRNNIPFLDSLEEQRQPALSWNLPANDMPSSGVVPVNREEQPVRRQDIPLEELDIPPGDPRFGLAQLDFLEQEIARLNEEARLRNLSRPPNKGRPTRLGCVSTNRAQPFPFPRQNTSKEGSDPHPGVPGDPRLRLSHSMRLKRERQRIICPLARPASESNTPSTNAFGQSTNYPPSTYNDVPMTPMQRHEQLLHEERKLFACWIARRNAKAPPRRRNNRASYTDLPPPFENGNTSYRALFRRQYSHLFTEPGEEPPRHNWNPEVLEYFPTRLRDRSSEEKEQCDASITSGTSTTPPALPNNGEPSSGALRRGQPLRRQYAFVWRSHPHMSNWDSNPKYDDPAVILTQHHDWEEQVHANTQAEVARSAPHVSRTRELVNQIRASVSGPFASQSTMPPPPPTIVSVSVEEESIVSRLPSPSTQLQVEAMDEDDDDMYATQEETDAHYARLALLEASQSTPSPSSSTSTVVEEEDSAADQDSESTSTAASSSFPAFNPGNVPAAIVADILSTRPPSSSLPSPSPSPSPPPSPRPTRQSSPSIASTSSSSSEGSRGTKRSRSEDEEESPDDAEEERATRRPRRASEEPASATPSRLYGRLSGVKAVAESVRRAFKKKRN